MFSRECEVKNFRKQEFARAYRLQLSLCAAQSHNHGPLDDPLQRYLARLFLGCIDVEFFAIKSTNNYWQVGGTPVDVDEANEFHPEPSRGRSGACRPAAHRSLLGFSQLMVLHQKE